MTDYYFGQGGSDSNNGLTYANRKATYADIVADYSPGGGDTVYICASTAGVQYRLTQQITLRSGTNPSTRFRIAAYPGSVILFDVNATGAISGNGISYATVEPGDGSFELGDIADWSASNYDGYTATRQINLVNCTDVQFIGTGTGNWDTTDSNFVVHGGSNYYGSSTDWDCDLIRFYGIDWYLHGTIDTNDAPNSGEPGQVGDDWGDMVQLRGDHILVDTCCFAEGGHNNAEAIGHHIIVQNSDLRGYHRSATSSTSGHLGMRAWNSIAGNTSNGGQSPYGPHLFQNNILQDSAESDNRDNPATKLETRHVIFRGNYIWDCQDRVWQSNPNGDYGEAASVGYLRIYHNTAYGNGSIGSFISTTSDISNNTDMFEYCDVSNNIFDQLGVPVFSRPHFRRYANNEQDDSGFGDNGWKGMTVRANIVNRSTADTVNCEFRPILGSFNTFTWGNGNAQYPNVFDANNVVGTPSYVGTPGFPSFERSRATFTPNGGIETGNAEPIATTNGSVTDSNTLVLQDGEAYAFKDDWGMSSLGISGDYIYLQEIDQIRQISSVDYANHTIVISGVTVSLSDNSPIYWVKEDGITICDSIGAGQSAGTPPDPDPVTDPVTTQVVWVHV